jgi:small-conductance mechanosensitive channel
MVPRKLAPVIGVWLGAAVFGADAPAPADPAAQQEPVMIAHLNSAVDWYHDVQAGSAWLFQPGDAFYWNTQKALGAQALKGAFGAAQAMLVEIAHHAGPSTAPVTPGSAQEARLEARLATNADQLTHLQGQLADLDQKISAAAEVDRAGLVSQREMVQAEIDLDSALAQTLQKASALLTNSTDDTSAANAAGRIAALQRSVPEVFDAGAEAAAKGPAPVPAGAGSSGGLVNRAAALFSLIRNERAMDRLIARTGDLQAAANRLAEPLRTTLRQTWQDGEQASDQAGSAADPAAMAALRAKIESAAVGLRDLSAVVLPLREETMALDRSRTNLEEWRRSFVNQTDAILRILFMRALTVIVVLALLLAISEIWRRATFKYVHDLRRRRQFLLIRRFATGAMMGIVITLGFVSDFSSLATFAGFITAGIAVALQTVVLSVAAYFFLIGRYGVRVGDRVTVSGVTGDVIDIGLVRVFLLELAGTGIDLHPTGRVVVLANSALFSSSPLYKQLPGSEYTWHEVYAAVPPESDTTLAQERLLAAVNAVYSGYRSSLEDQHVAVERLIDLKLDVPAPSAQVRFADPGLEVVVRFPVEIHRISEIDGLVTKEVLAALAGDEALRKSLAGTPRIRSAVKM